MFEGRHNCSERENDLVSVSMFFMDVQMLFCADAAARRIRGPRRLGHGYRTAAPFEIAMANGGRACVTALQSVCVFRTRRYTKLGSASVYLS